MAKITKAQIKRNRLKVIKALRTTPETDKRYKSCNFYIGSLDQSAANWWDERFATRHEPATLEEYWRLVKLPDTKCCAAGLLYLTLDIRPNSMIINDELAVALGEPDDDSDEESPLDHVWRMNDRGKPWPEIGDYLEEVWGLM